MSDNTAVSEKKNMYALERFLRACAQTEAIDDLYNVADYKTLANMLRGDKKLDIIFVKTKQQLYMVQKMLKEADITASPIRYDGELAILYPRTDREKYMDIRNEVINGGKLYSKGPYSYCDIKFIAEAVKQMKDVKYSVYKNCGDIFVCFYKKNARAIQAAENGLEKMRKNAISAKYLQYEDIAFEDAADKVEKALHDSDNVILLSESGAGAVYFAPDGVRVVKPGENPYDIRRDEKGFKSKVADVVFKNLVSEVGLIKVYRGDYARLLISGASDITKEEALKKLGIDHVPSIDELAKLEELGLAEKEPEAFSIMQRMTMAQIHKIEDKELIKMRPTKEERQKYREILRETIAETVEEYRESEKEREKAEEKE